MAKRKPGLPKEHAVQWGKPDKIALLSWLDHTLRHDELDFDTTIFSHLGGKHKPAQIEEKLERFWIENEPRDKWPSNWKEDYLRYGVSCLFSKRNSVDGIEKEEIMNAVQRLEDEFFAKQLQSPGRRLRTASKTAQAVVPEVEKCKLGTAEKRPPIVPYMPDESIEWQALRSPSQFKNKRQRRLANDNDCLKFQSSQERTGPGDVMDEDIALPAMIHADAFTCTTPDAESKVAPCRLRSSTLVNDSEADLSDAIHEDQATRGSTAQSGHTIPERPKQPKQRKRTKRPKRSWSPSDAQRTNLVNSGESERCVCLPVGAKNDAFIWIGCAKCNTWEHACCITERSVYICSQCAVDFTVPQSTHGSSLDEEAANTTDPKLASALGEIERLQEHLKSTDFLLEQEKMRTEELAGDISRLGEAQKLRDARTGEPFEKTIQSLLKDVSDLKQELQNREKFGTFTRLGPLSCEWFSKINIHEGFQEMYLKARDILCSFGGDKLPFSPHPNQWPELNTLLAELLTSKKPTMSPREMMAQVMETNPQALIRGLTTSAIRNWVFETEYPNIEQGSLLESYRESLLLQDGATALRNLDLAALSTYVNSKTFIEHDVPLAASKLAIRLSQILAPFFSTTSEARQESGWDGFATWRNERDEWEDRRNRLIGIFQSALLTKAQSCLNMKEYEMFIVPPGTVYDKTVMTVETRDGRTVENGCFDGMTVELCVEAAVFAYPRGEMIGETVESAVINRRNFGRREARERLGLKPLIKAAVILAPRHV